MRKPLLLLVAAIAACGGDPDPIDFVAFPDELEAATCEFQVACELMPDLATCEETFFFDEGGIDTIDNLIAAGIVIYDGAAAAACVDEQRNQGCGFPGFQGSPSACDRIFTGTVAAGGACEVDVECEGDSFCETTDINCDPDVACCAGTCVAPPDDAEIGENCEEANCVAGAYCQFPEVGAATCQAIVTAEGSPCDALDACANPMICELDFVTSEGFCLLPAASGVECDPEELIPCTDLRDYCDVASATCTPTVDVGATCSPDIECVGFATCVATTCSADPGLGDTCDPDGIQGCLGNTSCVGTTCEAPTGSSPECGL